MNPHTLQIREAIAALDSFPSGRYAWFGNTEVSRDVAVSLASRLSSSAIRDARVASLRNTLYRCFYQRGCAAPAGNRRLDPMATGRSDLAAPLAAANATSGVMSHGWRRANAVGGTLEVARTDGLRVRAEPESFELDPSTDTGSLRLPAGLPHRSPGHYIAMGSTPPIPGQPVVRIYWHLRPEAAVAAMGAVTSHLNDVGIGFAFKVINDSSGFTRCDTGVLYVARGDRDRALDLAVTVGSDLGDGLAFQVPALTQRVARGIAWAHDPPGGESFGLHRCTALAEGIVRGWDRGVVDVDGLLCEVSAALGEAGTSLAHPYRQEGVDA